MLTSTDVDAKTNKIPASPSLLDQINDPSVTIVTINALHCQRDHVAYLAKR